MWPISTVLSSSSGLPQRVHASPGRDLAQVVVFGVEILARRHVAARW